MDMRRKDLETFVALSEGTGPDHFLVPIGIMQELAEHLAASDDDPGGRPQEANRLREALLSSGREPAEPPNPYGPRVEIPQQLLHEAVQHLGSADNDLGSRPIEAARLREALLAEATAPSGSGLPPRIYAAAVLETGQLQAIAGQLRTALEMVESRERTLRDLAVEDLDRQAPAFSAAAAKRVREKGSPAHILRDRVSLCGIPAERFTRDIGLGVVEWRDLELRDPQEVLNLCQDCAKLYRSEVKLTGKLCTRCNGSGVPPDTLTFCKCRRCAGLGRYPAWAAAALEEEHVA